MRIISNCNLRYSRDLIPNLSSRSPYEQNGILQRKNTLRVDSFGTDSRMSVSFLRYGFQARELFSNLG